MVRRRHARFIAVATFSAAAVLGAFGCSSEGEPAESGQQATTLPSTTSTSLPSARELAETDALAAYEAMWDDMVAVAAIPDYQSPRLAEHAASKAVTTLVEGVYTLQRDGLVAKGELVSTPSATGAEPVDRPTKVFLTDCLDGTRWLNYTAAGELENDTPGGLRRTTATVEIIDGSWKVTDVLVGGIGTC